MVKTRLELLKPSELQLIVTTIFFLGLYSITSLAQAGAFIVFDDVYRRETGSPVTVTKSFTVLNPNTTYALQIYNGGLSGEFEKVSSAIISLNSQQVFGPNDFNQQVS